MARSTVMLGVVLALSLVLSSCRPIEQAGGSETGSLLGAESILKKDTVPFKDAIPRNYGRFVGVLQSPGVSSNGQGTAKT